MEVIARFSGCDAGPDEDDRRSVPRGLAVRFLLGGPHSTDLVSMSTNRFPVTTREAFLSVSAALSSRQPLRLLRVGYLCIVRQFWGPWTFLTTFAPKSYTRCDYYAIHTFMWSRGGTQPVRYRWRTPVPHRRPKPWTRLFKSRDYLSKDLADRLRGGGVRFSLEVQNGKEVAANRLRNLGRPLPRSVKWKPVGELHLDRIVTGDEESALSRIVFSPAHLCEGIEPYPGDEIFVARAAAYPASQVFRTGGSP